MIACSVDDFQRRSADQADDLARLHLQRQPAHSSRPRSGRRASRPPARSSGASAARSRRGRRRPRRGGSGFRPASFPPGRPLVEDVDALADVEHEATLWSTSRTPAPVADRVDRGGEARYLGLGKARRRLVHEHKARLGRQRAGDAEPPFVAVDEVRGRAVGVVGEASSASSSFARPPPRGRGADAKRGRPRRSRAPQAAERMAVLERPGESVPPRRYAGQRVTSRSSSSTRPCVGRSKPLRTLTSVDLPAPFGPIRPTTSPWPQLERDVAERLDSRERARDGGGRSDPPGLLARWATAASPTSPGCSGPSSRRIVPFAIGLLLLISTTRYCARRPSAASSRS